ncbi:FAD-dependent oxidoreductase [Actinomadura sp. LOL_016]|uniref:oxidoreductase n=1 Tax=unclassified Actinomadura TaxID=2626254 RepID=UPI003A806ADF
MSYPALAAPLRLGAVTLSNRIVSAPMERNYCGTDGTVTDDYIAYLEARAAGGAALVFSEASYVRADGRGRARQMGVAEDRHVPGVAAMTRAIHRHGAKAGVELNHGGRTVQSRISGTRPVAPSAVPCLPAGGDMPRTLGREEIHDIVECYGAAARRCREAGVDVLTIHGAHGYLIHQFLSPLTNRRDDEFAEPGLFLDLVLQAVRQAAPDLSIGIRVSALEGVPGGLDEARTLQLIRSSRLDLLDFIDVSAGNYEAGQWMVQPGEWPAGVLASYAAPYRDLGLPVGVAGRINLPDAAEKIITGGQADFVSMARALYADPAWPRQVLSGRRFRPCIACNLCIDRLHSGEPVPCTVNPDAGGSTSSAVLHSTSTRTVLVIGAGPAGLEAARLVAGQGHHVQLVEREPRIGGNFALAAGLKSHPEYRRVLDWYAAELDDLQVAVRTGAEAGPEIIAELHPDAVITATGGDPYVPDIDGADLPHVIGLREWLRRGGPPPQRCTIWGADREAMAVADQFAAQGGEVLIIGAESVLAPEAGPRARVLQISRLERNPNVHVHLDTRIRQIGTDHLTAEGPDGPVTLRTAGPLLISQGVRRFQGIGPSDHLAGEAAGAGPSMHAALRSAAMVAGRVLDAFSRSRPAPMGGDRCR